MFLCLCHALVYTLLHHPQHVMFFILCSIFLKMFLSFVWASFSHLCCTPHASSFTLVHIFFSFPSSSWFICLFMTKRGRVYWCVSSFLYDLWTFVGGESHWRDAYTKGEKTSFLRKPCFVLLFACFLIVLWCFELYLVSMLCCSHRIVFMCWKCIYSYTIVLYWLHIRIIISFDIWS